MRGRRNGAWGRLAVLFGAMVLLSCFCSPHLLLLCAAVLLIIAGSCSWRC